MIRLRWLLIAPGVLILAGAMWTGFETARFCSTAAHAGGVVDRDMRGAGGTHHPRVEFATPDGGKHKFTGASSPWPYEEGARVSVLYDETIPERAAIDAFGQLWFLTAVLSGLGLAFTLAPGIPLYFRARRGRKNEWLKLHGRSVQADFTGVLGDRSPYWIAARWVDPATQREHVFRSVDIWFDPTEQATRKTVTVIFDPADFSRYWMDLSFLTGYVKN